MQESKGFPKRPQEGLLFQLRLLGNFPQGKGPAQRLGRTKPWEDEEGGSELGKAAKDELGCPISFSHPHPRAKGCPGQGLCHLLASAWRDGRAKGWINQSGWRCSDLPRGSLSLETAAKAGGREAETLAALASTPRAASGSY